MGKKKKEKRNEVWCTWVVGKKEKKKINNLMKKSKSKNQNFIPNTIFLLNCDFSCETKTMYQIEFFLQS